MNITAFVLTMLMCCIGNKIISQEKQMIDDDKVYILYESDHEAPEEIEGFRQFEYETIYAIKLKNYSKSKQSKGLRLSEIGYKRNPVWNKKGDKIAYLSFIANDSTIVKKGQIIVQNVSSGEVEVLNDVNPCTCGLSWDKSGNILAFGEKKSLISIYDLKENKKEVLFKSKSRPEGISISPNGKHIIFMTRDGSHINDGDGWRPNLFTIGDKNIIKIGLTKDRFGVLSNFWWKNDSSQILFNGFLLDDENKRSYNYWTYDLVTQELNPYFEDLKSFQKQKVRYWEADKLY